MTQHQACVNDIVIGSLMRMLGASRQRVDGLVPLADEKRRYEVEGGRHSELQLTHAQTIDSYILGTVLQLLQLRQLHVAA